MLRDTLKALKPAFLLWALLTVITGLLYPLLITFIAQTFFKTTANGRLLTQNDRIIGSYWIGQSFTDSKYFWGRPSATPEYPYNSRLSSGADLALSNPAFQLLLKNRIDYIKTAHPSATQPIPIDLITSSASGLDPEISPESAYYQATRIATARHIPLNTVMMLIKQYTKLRTFGILGEPRINVLELNLALDTIH